MGQTHKGVSVSFPLTEHGAIAERAKELKLPARGGISQYFQMLREFDAKFKLCTYFHPSDGKLHFYPEGMEQAVAEQAGGETAAFSLLLEKMLRTAERKAGEEYPEKKRRSRPAPR